MIVGVNNVISSKAVGAEIFQAACNTFRPVVVRRRALLQI
jgi:hypothetical protein